MRLLRPVVSSLLCCSFLLPSLAGAELVDRSIAIVNHHVITELELMDESRDVVQQLSAKGVKLPPIHEIYHQVLEHLILKRAQQDLAEQYGIRVRDEEVNERLSEVAQQNGLTLLGLREVMEAREAESFTRLRTAIKDELTLDALRDQEVVARIRVTPDEVKHFVQRKLGLSGERVRYHLQHILVALPDTPSPEQIHEIQQKAEGIWSQLAQGQDFAQLAIRHSADAKALEGGNLGWLGLDEVPSFLENTVLQLGEQEISQPIQSPLGFHILKLLGREVEKQSAQLPADVEQQALRILRTQKGNQLYEQWLRRLRDEAFVTILAPEYQRD